MSGNILWTQGSWRELEKGKDDKLQKNELTTNNKCSKKPKPNKHEMVWCQNIAPDTNKLKSGLNLVNSAI